MAVLENVESKMGSSDLDNSIQTHGLKNPQNSETDSNLEVSDCKIVNGNSHEKHQSDDEVVVNGGFDYSRESGSTVNEGLKRDMEKLEELFSNLNPMAPEFVPVSVANGFNYGVSGGSLGGGFGFISGFVMPPPGSGDVDGHMARRVCVV